MKLNVQQRGASVLLLQSTAPADGESDLVAEVHTSSEDARRVVACLNACKGISTENLEDNKPIIELANDYNAVLKQRNELLAVVEHIRRCVPYVGFAQIHAGSKTVADMDAVIAKVRGDAERKNAQST